jgi:TolA-binding protein
MAQGDGLNVQQSVNIEAELERVQQAQERHRAELEQASQRTDELNRALNRLRGSQPEVSTVSSGHERGQMGDGVSMASSPHESDASEDDLEMESPNEGVSDGDFVMDDDGSSDGSNIYDA